MRRNFGAKIASAKIANLKAEIRTLKQHPFMGKSCDRHDENFRLLVSKPNVVIYDINDEVIEILHIVDARTDYTTNLL